MMNRDNGNQPKNGLILTAREVCSYLKIPLTTLYGLSKRGIIPATKIGKHWRYVFRDVQGYLEGKTKPKEFPKEESADERREHERINCEIPVYVQHALKRKGENVYEGTIYNLSAGGILFVNTNGRVEKTKELEIGDPVKVFFKMPSTDQRSLAVDGKVVHCTIHEESAIGIKFRDMPTGDHELIQSFVG